MKTVLQLFIFSQFAFASNAQDSIALPEKLTISGYFKDLQTLRFDQKFKELIAGNLLHNRINLKWRLHERLTGNAEFRNRLFWGEEVKGTPGFASFLKNENEKVNMQKVWINNASMVLHTNTERLNVEYRDTNFNIRIGRQRINWGITTTWNPNDIFNTYNFLDFDYEERPGSDGMKLQYIINDFFNVELGYAHTGKESGNVSAIKYNLNRFGYDMQLITGLFKENLTIGAGWAGSIKDAGFKGEFQYFFRNKDSSDHFNLSLETDYMFKKGWYVNTSMLYNNHGLSKPVNNWQSISLKLSPENPMPTRWNFIVTSSKEFTPILSGNVSAVYAPGTKLLILLPSLQYNIAANLDLSLVWQSFFTSFNDTFRAVNHHCFLRIKLNY